MEDKMSVRCQGARVGESPAWAVRVAWERYVGEIVGETPTFLHADLTLWADPAVSAQFEKKSETSKYRGTSAHYTHHASDASV